MGKKVLVVDHSIEQEVMNCIEKPLDLEGMIHYNQVDYIGDGVHSKDLLDAYDIVLQLLSKSELTLSEEELEQLFIVTDTRRKSLEGAMSLIQNSKLAKQLIIRDICDKRYGKNYFARLYVGKEAKECAISRKQIYEIEFDDIDYYYRIQLEHEVFRKFYSLSKGLKELLFSLASEFSQMPMKYVKEAYKVGKRRR